MKQHVRASNGLGRQLRDDSGVTMMTYVVFAVLLVAAIVGAVIAFSNRERSSLEVAGYAAGGNLKTAKKAAQKSAENYEVASARAIDTHAQISGGEFDAGYASGGFWDSVDGFLSGAWDYVAWQTGGASEMKNELDRANKLFWSGEMEVPEEGCPCAAVNYNTVRKALIESAKQWQHAYGAVNGFAAVAYASKMVGDGMEALFNVVEPACFQGIASKILSRINAFQLANAETDNFGEAVVKSQLLDGEKLAKSLSIVSSKTLGDCGTAEERAAYLQAILDVRNEIRNVGDLNSFASTFGLEAASVTYLNNILEHTDTLAKTGETALDGYQALIEAEKYFKNVSEAMSMLDQMKDEIDYYENDLAMYREQAQAGGCSCGSGCGCRHCK